MAGSRVIRRSGANPASRQAEVARARIHRQRYAGSLRWSHGAEGQERSQLLGPFGRQSKLPAAPLGLGEGRGVGAWSQTLDNVAGDALIVEVEVAARFLKG